ncbi:hypothetical protein [Streptomyces chiangmaiensis]|uniref:DUF5666 domain-containing protein n=1 Tax=Streptomyces chiangmaiensis TaxID=766497 RepID=A0ABU7FY29_9ACTN|nr:hypothetical protein [Streptomyces chiangmaiensis]MED7828483.1 hypothetical protein [Streptomyces chiangmaiensis]
MNDNYPTSQSPAGANPGTVATHARRGSALRRLSKKKGAWIVAAGLTCALAGVAGLGTASATTPTAATVSPSPSGGGARSAPSDGGATGIVDSTSDSGFTFSTATGVEVTVDETSTTAYTINGHDTSAKTVEKGKSVLVLGVVDSATITATRVDVQPGGDGGAAAAEAAGVIAFQQGTPSPVKSVGQIPNYTEGEGTIVSGTTAYKATKAAQAVVPGGIVDRVVELNNGQYEVHNISINWPHHVFVSKDFKVLGYE